MMRAGVIHNPLSHANLRREALAHPGALFADPASSEELNTALAWFKTERVELLIIDGGDGTVREVLTALPAIYGADPPLLSVVASGKTNILAFDLGIRGSWTVDAALEAASQDGFRVRIRSPLQITRPGSDAPPCRGFFFGAAGFVRATDMAQGLHRSGVVRNASVGLTLAEAVTELMTGAKHGAWSHGEPLSLTVDAGPPRCGRRLVTLATTLERLPFALRPFGPARHGLKFLDVDAPPRRMARALPTVLWGRNERWLGAHGYRRGDARELRLSLEGSVVLDGEVFPGGDMILSEAPALRFLTP
jgi:hypothetical protein